MSRARRQNAAAESKNRRAREATDRFTPVEGRTPNQKLYIRDILENDYAFGIGPAGTGKTCIAAGIGAELLVEKKVKKLVLTRPMITTEKAGFLPGDAEKKIAPFLTPLFDELNQFIHVDTYMKKGLVVIEPIAYLRGRTIKDSFIVVDEAQNCTYAQLRMIITRLGEGSKMVITGDLTQSDLPQGDSGLAQLLQRVGGARPGVSAIRLLTRADIIRHASVSEMLFLMDGEDPHTP